MRLKDILLQLFIESGIANKIDIVLVERLVSGCTYVYNILNTYLCTFCTYLYASHYQQL